MPTASEVKTSKDISLSTVADFCPLLLLNVFLTFATRRITARSTGKGDEPSGLASVLCPRIGFLSCTILPPCSHEYPIRGRFHHATVVRNEKYGGAEFIPKALQQVYEFYPQQRIKCSCRFIGYKQ